MADRELIESYNYDAFVPEKFERWLSFDKSPALGEPAPSFPLLSLQDGSERQLADLWGEAGYLVVEFGSFT